MLIEGHKDALLAEDPAAAQLDPDVLLTRLCRRVRDTMKVYIPSLTRGKGVQFSASDTDRFIEVVVRVAGKVICE